MKKLSKIMGLLVVLTMLVGLLPMASASPAGAAIGTLGFGTITTPMSSPIIYATTEVSTFAVTSNGTMYIADQSRAVGATTGWIRRGGAWGAGWADLSAYAIAGIGAANLPVWQLAAAPDDPNFVVAVAQGRQQVWVSFDQGFTWTTTSFVPAPATEVITDITVTAKYPVAGGDARDLIVCTEGTPAVPGGGRILALKLQPYGVSAWTNQAGYPALTSFRAVRAAPAFAGDFSFIAVGAQAAGTVAVLGVRDINANTTNYASSASFPLMVTAGATLANLTTADLAFPSDYQGQVDRMRRFWVALDTGAGATSGIWRVDGRSVTTLSIFQAGIRPYKMSYSGTVNTGKMIVGIAEAAQANGTVSTYRSLNATSNAVTWDLPYKGASGAFGLPGTQESRGFPMWKFDGKEAVVATMTTNLVVTPANYFNYAAAGTWTVGRGNDETALSVTRNDGDTWAHYQYIDTISRGITDVDASADTKIMYIASANDPAGLDSIWKSTNGPGFSAWERVGLFNAGGAIIVKISPDKADGSVVFWGDKTGAAMTIQRSIDGADTWSNAMPGLVVQDFAVIDQNNVLAVTAGGVVRKGTSTGPGWMWTANYDPRMGSANRIYANGSWAIIAPGTAGMTFPAYSTDGGLTFTRIMFRPADATGSLFTGALDPKVADNKTFFFGTNTAGAAPAVPAVGDTVTLPVSIPAAVAGTYFIPVPGTRIVQGATTFVSEENVSITVPVTTTAYVAGTAKVLAATEVPGTTFAGFRNITGSTGNVWRWTVGKNTTEWDAIGAPVTASGEIEMPGTGWLFRGSPTAGFGVGRSTNALDGHPKPGVNWDALITGLAGTTSIFGVASSGKAGGINIYVTTYVANDLFGFIDTLVGISPNVTEPKLPAGADAVTIPVAFTGFATPFGAHWNLPVPQAAGYWYQLSAASDFSDVVQAGGTPPAAAYAPANTGDPSIFFGNPAAIGIIGGGTYYFRVKVRTVDSGQAVQSDWSKPLKMVVQSGVPVQAPYSAPQPQAPVEGAKLEVPASVGFTWTPMPGATEYKFVLATDANLVKTLVSTTVTNTAYSYDTALKEGTYFWQVTQTKPIPSSPSPVASFTVVAKAAPPAAPVVNVPAPVVNVQQPPATVATPAWVWVVIAIGAVLVIVTIVLIFRTRKV